MFPLQDLDKPESQGFEEKFKMARADDRKSGKWRGGGSTKQEGERQKLGESSKSRVRSVYITEKLSSERNF